MLLYVFYSFFISSSTSFTFSNLSPHPTFHPSSLRAIPEPTLSDLITSPAQIDTEANSLNFAITSWLDSEWLPQRIHSEIGTQAADSFKLCLSETSYEVSDIMMRISADLEASWANFNDDAFVNAYDVANFASEYLMMRLGAEKVCGTSDKAVEMAEIARGGASASSSASASASLFKSLNMEGEFERFMFLSRLLDNEEPASNVNAVASHFFLDPDEPAKDYIGAKGTVGDRSGLEKLQLLLPEADDEDGNNSLWEIVKARQGETFVQQKLAAGDDEGWAARALITRALVHSDFLK